MHIRHSIIAVSIIGIVGFFGFSALAANIQNNQTFNINLHYGIYGNADVSRLQKFLTTKDLYTGPITGNFLSLTLQAVKDFQKQNSIDPVSGFFGPLTRAKANISVTQTIQTPFQWGVYIGNGANDLADFESLTGAKVDILADFEDWSPGNFPSNYASSVGPDGKTLVIFWEPQYNYDTINSGSEDSYISQFAASAKSYGYPIILVPFDEMNINENAWGDPSENSTTAANSNTPAKFIQAWQRIHDLFSEDANVKFGWDINNVSIPDTASNTISLYYPGDTYVDYVGADGFNFGNPNQSFGTIFDSAIEQLETYGKPIYIFSTGSYEYSGKAGWITDGLGSTIKNYPDIAGWIWFDQNDGKNNFLIDSDFGSLAAFKAVVP